MEYFPEGVLNSDQLRQLHEQRVIHASAGLDAKGSALDLHLGVRGWMLNGSIKQIDSSERVEIVCDKYGSPFELTEEGIVLKRGGVAVVQLEEEIDFSQHPWFEGEATYLLHRSFLTVRC